MSDSTQFLKFGRARLSGRQISELVGLCRGLIADGEIVQSEYVGQHPSARESGIREPEGLINDMLERS